MTDDTTDPLFEQPLRVINVGLEGFARELDSLGVAVVQVDWRPPAGGDPTVADLLAKLGA